MKKTLYSCIATLTFLCTTPTAHAQSGYLPNGFYLFGWDVNVPLNNRDFIDRTSLAGGKAEGRFFVTPNISVGGEISWSSLYQYSPKRTYQFDNGAVTTDLYKYIYLLPMNLNAHYYFKTDGQFMPYAGLGLGAMYSEQDLYFNIYNLYETNWGFLVKPEAGMLLKFGENSRTGMLFGVRYNYATNRQTDFKIDKIKTLSFQLGIAFMN
jgi:opacity protein-like surface antigen